MKGAKLQAPPSFRDRASCSGDSPDLQLGVQGVSFGIDPKGRKADQLQDRPPPNFSYPTLKDESLSPSKQEPWVPGGKFELPDYPPPHKPLKVRRPLSAATLRPTPTPTQRTVPQLEESLRRWLIQHRRLHEDKRITLVRGLTSGLRIAKDTTGVPLRLLDYPRLDASHYSIAQEDNFRASRQVVAESTRGAKKPGESNVDFTSMSFAGNRQLPDFSLADPASTLLEGDDTFQDAVRKIRDDPELTEAERWGLEYRMRVGLKKALKVRGSPQESWGVPPPKSLGYKLQLMEARREAENAVTAGTSQGKTKLALRGTYVTAQQLQSSWSRMLAEEQMKGREPCLVYPLSDAEAASLLEAYGSLLFKSDGLVGEEEGTLSRTLGQNAIDLARLVESIINRKPLGSGGGATPSLASTLSGRPTTAPVSALRDQDTYETRFGHVTVRAPSTLDVKRAMGRSATRPSCKLRLEHVHGYYGMKNTSNNVWFTGTPGEIAFFAAGVGIIASLNGEGGEDRGPGDAGPGPGSVAPITGVPKTFEDRAAPQRFFKEHTDDIQCIAVHPKGHLVATGQIGAEPFVLLWDPVSHRLKSKLRHDRGNRSVHACAFGGPDGRFLATVCTDNQHTVTVWDWAVGRRLSEGAGYKGHPPQVYGVLWDPHGENGEPGNRFVTYGVNHLKIWTPELVTGQGVKWFAKNCQWNGIKPCEVLSAAFLPPGLDDGMETVCRALSQVDGATGWRGTPNRRTNPSLGIIVTGHAQGQMLFWKDEMCIRQVQLYSVANVSFGNSPGSPETQFGVRALSVVNLNSKGTRAAAEALAKSASTLRAQGVGVVAGQAGASRASDTGSLRSSTLNQLMDDLVGQAAAPSGGGSSHRTGSTTGVDSVINRLVRDAGSVRSSRRGGGPPSDTSSRDAVNSVVRHLVEDDSFLSNAPGSESSSLAVDRALEGLVKDTHSDVASSRLSGRQGPRQPPPRLSIPAAEPTVPGQRAVQPRPDDSGPAVADSMDSTVDDLLFKVIVGSPPASPPGPSPPPSPPQPSQNHRYGAPSDLASSLTFSVPGGSSIGYTAARRAPSLPQEEEEEQMWDKEDQWVLLAGGADGIVRMFALGNDTRLPPRDANLGPIEFPVPSWPQIYPQPLRAIDFDTVSRTLVVGTYDCDLWVWRVPEHFFPYPVRQTLFPSPPGGSLWRRIVNGQSGDLFGVAPHPKAPEVFATSCSDNEVYVYHAGKRTIVGSPLIIKGSSTCCAFSNPDGALLAVGQSEGLVQVFNRHRNEVFRYQVPPPKGVRDDLAQLLADKSPAYQGILEAHTGVTVIAFSPDGSVMAVGSRDNYIRLFSVEKLSPPSRRPSAPPAKKEYFDPLEMTRANALPSTSSGPGPSMPDTEAGKDSRDRPSPPTHAFKHYATCTGNSSTVLSIDFSTDGRVLMTVSQGYELLYWDTATGRQLSEDQRDTSWSTFTAKIGFNSLGVFTPDLGDGTDINTVDRDPQGELLVAADDLGGVRLYNFPVCNKDSAAFTSESGHSSHVMMARFTCDGSRVISVGGYDRCVMQWEVIRSGPGSRDAIDEEIDQVLGGVNWEPSTQDQGGALPAAATSAGGAIQPPEHIRNDPGQMQAFLLARRDSGRKYKNHRLATLQAEMDAEMEKMAARDEERKLRLQQLQGEKDAIDAALAARNAAGGPRALVGKKALGRKEVNPKPGKVWGPLDDTGKTYGWVEDLDLLGGGVSDDDYGP